MPTNETYDGVSLVPLVDGTAKSTGKNMSFSQYARGFAARETPPPYPPTNLSDLWCEKRTNFAPFNSTIGTTRNDHFTKTGSGQT